MVIPSNMMISVTTINFVVYIYESGRNLLIIGPMFYWKYYGKFSSVIRLSDIYDVNN